MNDALITPRKTLGRYEILGEIARGAMGVVYKARDPLIDRLVAIKTVTLGLSDAETEAFERRFFREAKSAGRLNHPNVVTIHDVGKSDDVAYIAMEFLDGRSLREIMDSGVVLPPQRIADITAEIAEGLAFAHRNGVIHRDVKPANVMVLASGAVKITDFGIALLPTGTRTLSGNVFGSPRYTSPEQVMGRTVDGRSDIFSLGAVLYELLTGVSPFTGNDLNGILKAVLSDPTPAPSSHNPKLPRAFDHIVGKALAKDPSDRYQDADEMARELRGFDTMEFASPGLAPLPALEHPTQPIEAVAVEDLAPPPPMAEEEALLPASDPIVAAAAVVPWWRKSWALGAAALGALALLGVVAWSARDPSAVPPKPADAARSSGTIAAASSPAAAASAAAPPTPASVGAPAVASAPEAAPAQKPAETAASAAPAVPGKASDPTSVDGGVASTAAGTSTAAAGAAQPGATPPAAPPKPMGRIALAVTPWGEVYLDGRKRGVSPPMHELRVAPGKHVVEIRNTTFPPHTESVDVAADATVRIKHKFQ